MKQADQYLIDRYFQGTLSEEDIVAINQLLDSSREARDYFRKAALLDSALHEKASLPLPEIASRNQPHPCFLDGCRCLHCFRPDSMEPIIRIMASRSYDHKFTSSQHFSNPTDCQVD